MSGDGAELVAVRLSRETPARRARLLETYRSAVYEPAFPDESIREDPRYWLGLLDAAEYPAPPQPLIEVVLLTDGADRVFAGVTIEYYRDSRCGLLTYIAVAPEWRGRGLGRKLVAAAREMLDAMGGGDVPMFAETERLDDAAGAKEIEETALRQKRLAGLGARLVRFDYVMPPLRSDSAPHRLHLLLFDARRQWREMPAGCVAALIRELAAALVADLEANAATRAMMARLEAVDALPLGPLPATAENTA